MPLQDPSSFTDGQLELDADVRSRKKRVPCLTTPSPDASGRDPPKRQRGKTSDAARQRWLADGRCYAPWQYESWAMAAGPDGPVNLTATMKEKLHNYPADWTAVHGVATRARHRMLANSWHVMVATLMFLMVLHTDGAVVHGPAIPACPSRSAIDDMLLMGNVIMAKPGPGQWTTKAFGMPPTFTDIGHWEASRGMLHPATSLIPLEPGLEATASVYFTLHQHLRQMRSAVIAELHNMVSEWEPVTEDWFGALPSSLQSVYSANNTKMVTQIPLLLHLLDKCGFPDLENLADDLNHGFAVVGRLHPGSGWLPKTDQRYNHPIGLEEFSMLNKAYLGAKLPRARPDPHWQIMLDELIADKEKGRVAGPFYAAGLWGVHTVPVKGHQMTPVPDEQAHAAVCFSVTQSDKIRRCEDFRRSFHNSTFEVKDAPVHHDVGTYVSLARHIWAKHQVTPMLWCQDLEAAYRQVPLRPGPFAYCALVTPAGVSLWQHLAACFGATSSVWSFNRFADCLISLCRRTLILMVGHYVDDFAGLDHPDLADSGCDSFCQCFQLLGLDTKASKEQRPAFSHKLLGVIVTITNEDVVVSPCPKRVKKVRDLLRDIKASGQLSPQQAQHCSGKLNFLLTAVFGCVGQAALQPLYARAAGLGQVDSDGLNPGLIGAIDLLLFILDQASPRRIPMPMPGNQEVAVLYTDAFVEVGPHKFSTGDPNIPEGWSPRHRRPKSNGWGFVFRTSNGSTYYCHGQIPSWFVTRFSSRKAYIYMLEVLAVAIAVTHLRALLPPFFVIYIDNQPGKSAIQKGYGKDPWVNVIISSFWALVTARQWHPHLQYVKSCLNISDAISRHDESTAVRLGWTKVHLDVLPFLHVLDSFGGESNCDIPGLLRDIETCCMITPSGVVGSGAVWWEQAPAHHMLRRTIQPSQRRTKD